MKQDTFLNPSEGKKKIRMLYNLIIDLIMNLIFIIHYFEKVENIYCFGIGSEECKDQCLN